MTLLMALAACLLGYGEVGLWLEKEAAEPNTWVKWEGNPYRRWIEDYAGQKFQHAVTSGLGASRSLPLGFLFSQDTSILTRLTFTELIEARATADPPTPVRYAEWLAVWERCVRLEKGFWDMAMNLS